MISLEEEMLTFWQDRLDEDELWATEASRYGPMHEPVRPRAAEGVHWQWVTSGTDDATVAPNLRELFVGEASGSADVKLLSRETWPIDKASDAYRAVELPQFALEDLPHVPSGIGGHIIRHDPARVIREVLAKRSRKLFLTSALNDIHLRDFASMLIAREILPYAEHPKYDPSWRPGK